MFRTIVETSSMINNDEIIYYTENEITQDMIREGERLIFSRKVYAEENIQINDHVLEAGNEEVSELTKIIDGFYKFKRSMALYELIGKKISLTKACENYLAYHFYDCMSGGSNQYILSLIYYLCRNGYIELDTPIYPNGDTWTNFNDFIKEIETHHTKIPKFEDVYFKYFAKCFPNIKKLFLPGQEKV